ncbi:MAG: PAS domain S-box protein [Methanospirillum sp.]
MPLSLRSRPFSLTLFVFIVALIMLVVVGITLVDYSIAESNLRNHQRLLEEQTEIDLNNSIMLVDEGLKLFDNTMNGEMEQGLAEFANGYERAGRDPSAMNLTAIKHDVFHDTMDLYVINASNMVEFTTYPPDQDLDFGNEPDFAHYLDGIRNTSGFYPDRVVRETGSNILRKYAYAPTADHRYILELGLIGDKFKSERQRLTYTETIKDIKSLNPYLEDARLFTQFKRQVGNSSFRPDAELKDRLGRVIETKTGFDWIDPATGNKVRYKYINLKDEDYGSDLSMVAELTYSSRPLEQALSDLVGFHVLAAFAALLIGLVTAGIVSGRLTSPIRGLVGDVDAIAQGDLDHPISPSTAREVTVLQTSIATMIGRLKETIEQLQRHEAKLSESEDRYRRTLDLISDYAYCEALNHDEEWRPVWSAGAPERICGYTFDQLIAIGGWGQIVHPEDRTILARHIEAVKVNQPHESEFRILSSEGEVRWVSHRTMPIMDPDLDRVTGYYAAGQDVTDRKRNEAALRESEEKYRQLVEDANSIILRLGPDGTIWYVNEFAERFFGYDTGELLGRDVVGTIVPQIDSEGRRTSDLVHTISRDPTAYTVNQNENVRKDGTPAYISWTNRAIFGDDGSPLGILCVGNDITRLKEAEDENRQLYAELEERVRKRTEDLAAANRELESFTYTVSHDLRSPLRAIDGYTYILLHEHQPELTGSGKRYLNQISQNARRMARLIDDLLNFSRTGRQALAIRKIDPAVLVAEVLDDLAGELQGRDVRVTVGDLASCRADPALLKQVFANLIGNALKFTRNREVAEIEIGSSEETGGPVYYIRDNGVGFDQKYAKTLFQVFHRLHDAREYEGTGVGLAIVQRIIERHGGRCWVESEPGRGTTFFFTLSERNDDGTERGEGYPAG